MLITGIFLLTAPLFSEGVQERAVDAYMPEEILEEAEAAAERAEEAADRAETAAESLEPEPQVMFGQDSDQYVPSWNSINEHEVPEWFQDAKLGIMICWGPYSVPAYAPPSGELGEFDFSKWFRENPYAEWYANSYKIEGTPTNKYHKEKYGADVSYEDLIDMWKAENYNPEAWAELFSKIGVRYTVSVIRHHDGFAWWPSEVIHPRKGESFSVKNYGPGRDLVGPLSKALREKGIKPGLYYSTGLDWSFEPGPITTWAELSLYKPATPEYASYAYHQLKEIIHKYKPEVLWGDIGWPAPETEYLTKYILADYYNTVPNGVVNDRLTDKWQDFKTAEYNVNQEPAIAPHKWELTRGIGFSFGYNHVETEEHYTSVKNIVHSLVDIVSKNGNLLLNIGPKADGTIPQIQKDRLLGLGKWLDVNGAAIFETRPWTQFKTTTNQDIEVRFTQNKENKKLYITLFERPDASFTIKDVSIPADSTMKMLGSRANIDWSNSGKDIAVEVAGKQDYTAPAYVLEVSLP